VTMAHWQNYGIELHAFHKDLSIGVAMKRPNGVK
jgi:hypothetical protein